MMHGQKKYQDWATVEPSFAVQENDHYELPGRASNMHIIFEGGWELNIEEGIWT